MLTSLNISAAQYIGKDHFQLKFLHFAPLNLHLIQTVVESNIYSISILTKQQNKPNVALSTLLCTFVLYCLLFTLLFLYLCLSCIGAFSLCNNRYVRSIFDYYHICTVVLAVKRHDMLKVRCPVIANVSTFVHVFVFVLLLLVILYCYCEWHKVVELTCYVICFFVYVLHFYCCSL